MSVDNQMLIDALNSDQCVIGLLNKGMESMAEQLHELKQENSRLQAENVELRKILQVAIDEHNKRIARYIPMEDTELNIDPDDHPLH